jgi:hypothetical protein
MSDDGGTIWDDPNQQVVRDDQSASWEEGTGGVPGPIGPEEQAEISELDAMTKEQLLERAQEMGLSPANAAMSKSELRSAIEAAEE